MKIKSDDHPQHRENQVVGHNKFTRRETNKTQSISENCSSRQANIQKLVSLIIPLLKHPTIYTNNPMNHGPDDR